MSVFAVARSIARSREKSLYIQLNMERFELWAPGERGAGRQQRRASDATRAGARLCPGSALEFERAHRSANPRGEPSLTVSVELPPGRPDRDLEDAYREKLEGQPVRRRRHVRSRGVDRRH